ncbi:hypothetical protein LINPERPRIM_LOCUS17129 [Linum perenne]
MWNKCLSFSSSGLTLSSHMKYDCSIDSPDIGSDPKHSPLLGSPIIKSNHSLCGTPGSYISFRGVVSSLHFPDRS